MCVEQPNAGIILIGIEDRVGDDPAFVVSSPDVAAAGAAEVSFGPGGKLVDSQFAHTRGRNVLRLYASRQWRMKYARCAVGVATDATVTQVRLERERLDGDGEGKLHALAVA